MLAPSDHGSASQANPAAPPPAAGGALALNVQGLPTIVVAISVGAYCGEYIAYAPPSEDRA